MTNDKKARLQAIRHLVATGGMQRQEQIVELLAGQGFACTQTMLSRDLKQLRISKVRTKDGRQFYVMPREGQFVTPPTKEEINAAKWYVQFSAPMAEIHTPPGHASLVAYDIDEQRSRHSGRRRHRAGGDGPRRRRRQGVRRAERGCAQSEDQAVNSNQDKIQEIQTQRNKDER